jgi:hypothetical protein
MTHTARLSASIVAGVLLAIAGGTAAKAETTGCEQLTGLKFPASSISLPSSGGEVTAARMVQDGEGGKANGAYCRVQGAILPADPKAPRILWQVNLPEHWNHKAVQFGGGGYNGNIPDTLGPVVLGSELSATPLARGFITFASDSGHQAPDADDASFALNDEALENFGWQHIRKTLDAMRVVAKAHYGEAPRRTYFTGGSTGGREALTAASRWPEAYDGILSNYPTAAFMGLRLWGAVLTRAVYDDESAGWIPPKLVNQIAAEALKSCDALDGAADGLVSNPDACRAKAPALLESLRCKPGATSPDCLSPLQVERSIAVYHDGYKLPYQLANGFQTYPGYNSLEGITMQLGSQSAYLNPPVSGPNAHHSSRADQFMRYFVARKTDLDIRNINVLVPGPYTDRIIQLSKMIDATNPDFTKFAAYGGKIILLQGDDDPSVSPLVNRGLYEAVVAHSGQQAADKFMRFYLVPGLAHGGGRFSPVWENLTALDNWVENDVPPAGQVIVDGTKTATRGRTRPLCDYPTWPKYKGSGDINAAASFTCER